MRKYANRADLLLRIRKDIARLGSQKALAGAIGIGEPYLSDILHGNRDPGKSVLRFYGLKEESVYVRGEVAS